MFFLCKCARWNEGKDGLQQSFIDYRASECGFMYCTAPEDILTRWNEQWRKMQSEAETLSQYPLAKNEWQRQAFSARGHNG